MEKLFVSFQLKFFMKALKKIIFVLNVVNIFFRKTRIEKMNQLQAGMNIFFS